MNVGFAVDNLVSDQFSHTLIKYCNSICTGDAGCNHSPIIFTNNVPKFCITPMFATMNILEAYNYSGLLIATSFTTLRLICDCIGPTSKFLYMWNPEWSRPGFDFRSAYELVHSEAGKTSTSVSVIVRSPAYRQILKNNFNIESKVSDNFNIGHLLCN